MDIYFRTDKSIVKMNDILEAQGKFLVMSSLDRKAQAVLEIYRNEQRTKDVLDMIDSILTRKGKSEEKILIIEVPKE